MSGPWSELGLPGPAGLPEIRRAYAQRLKTTHPEEDPEGFQRLHAAYQEASRLARRAARSAPEWDPGGLLEPEEAPREKPPEPPPPEWDYERLFAEGEAEAQAQRRERLEDLRHQNWARYAPQARLRRELDEEEAWPAVLAAVRALELLERSGAPPAQWRRFLDSPVFLSVRADMDFVLLLEDFLARRPDLSPEVRRAIFDAYEAQNASRYPAYKPLYRLLGVSREDTRRAARARSPWRNAWRSYPPWRRAVVAVCFTILALFFSIGVGVNLRSALEEREAERWPEQAPKWLEEDYGEPFVHAASKDIFAPAADPELYFRASPWGERSGDWPGYQTNYPHVLVRRALEDFAEKRELDLELGSYSHEIGDAPGAYLLDLPLLGAEEDVAALGALLEDLSRQDWYQVPPIDPGGEAEYRTREPVRYTVYLCHKGLAFYEAPSGGGFDTEEALALYAQAGPAFCRWILEESGLAAEHLGEGAYALQDREALRLGGQTFFQVSGTDRESGGERVRYFLDAGGGTLFCLPPEKADALVSIPDLYRGSIRRLQLDKAGPVTVMDQTQ